MQSRVGWHNGVPLAGTGALQRPPPPPLSAIISTAFGVRYPVRLCKVTHVELDLRDCRGVSRSYDNSPPLGTP